MKIVLDTDKKTITVPWNYTSIPIRSRYSPVVYFCRGRSLCRKLPLYLNYENGET